MKRNALLAFIFAYSLLFSQTKLIPSDELLGKGSFFGTGRNVGSLGDINGDGYTDFYVTHDLGVQFFWGNNQGKLIFNQSYNNLTSNLSHGDVNGDGFEDVIHGYYYENKIQVYLGNVSGIKKVPDFEYQAPEKTGQFGFTVDASADINKDGYDDIIVGQPQLSRGGSLYGKAFIFMGKATDLLQIPNVEYTTVYGLIGYGGMVRHIGDINNDGYGDVAIAALPLDNQILVSSFIDVYLGSATGLKKQNNIMHTVNELLEISSGDVNNDGFDDLVVADRNGLSRTIIYAGAAEGLTTKVLFDYNKGTGKGLSIGDFNDDNYADIAIADPSYSPVAWVANQGKIEIFLGNARGVSDTSSYIFAGDRYEARIGNIVAVGDMNKDGFDDLFLGWEKFYSGDTIRGKVVLFNGRTTTKSAFTISKRTSCTNYNLKFKNTSNVEALNFDWDFGDGISSKLREPQHSYPNAGKFYIKLKAYDKFGHTSSFMDSIQVYPPLQGGSYTLGGTSPTFNNITAFNTAIQCGANGVIDVSVASDIYTHDLIFDSLDLYNDPTKYSIRLWAVSPSAPKPRILSAKIHKSSHITLQGLSFVDSLLQNEGWLEGYACHILKANHIHLENCAISGSRQSGDPTIKVDSSNHILIQNSLIYTKSEWSSSRYGIVGKKNKNMTINHNEISLGAGRFYTIDLDSSENVAITENTIHGLASSWVYRGVNLNNIKGITVERNKIYHSQIGLQLENCNGAQQLNTIANNAISATLGYNQYYGNGKNTVSMIECKNLNFYHNTISAYNKANNSEAGALYVSGDSISIKNNIMKAISCITIQQGSDSHIESDYNFFMGNITPDLRSVEEWQRRSNQDMNSIQDTISFENDTLLIPISNLTLLNESAFSLPQVRVDIDSVPRGAITTDIGAYLVKGDTSLHYAKNLNIRILKVVTDSLYIGDNNIEMLIVNDKPVAVDSIIISYKIDSDSTIKEFWTGHLQHQDTLRYIFKKTYSINKGRVYNITTRVVLTKEKVDAQPKNNTLSKELYARMAGLYTVHGIKADFSNIATANDHLRKAGVVPQSMVSFIINPREDFDTLYIENGPVEYVGASPGVRLKLASTYQKKNALVKKLILHPNFSAIIDCQNISFDSCTFAPLQTTNGLLGSFGALEIGPSKDIKVRYCTFKNFPKAISFSNYFSSIFWNYYQGENEISYCNFDSVTNGIVIATNSDQSNWGQPPLLIDHNRINASEGGITGGTFSRISFTISNNIIHGQVSFENTRNCKIYNNKFSGSNYNRFRNLENTTIYNNMIKGVVSLDQYGPNVLVYNNTVKGGVSISNELGHLLKFYNNMCISDSNFAIFAPKGKYEGRHNNYLRRDGGTISATYSIYYETADSLNKSGQEKYATAIDPMFVSEDKLYSTSRLLKNRGVVFNNLTFDIDNNLRGDLFADIGANIIDGEAISTAPQLIKTSPANHTMNVDLNPSLTFYFDRKVTIDTGKIYIMDDLTNERVETILNNHIIQTDSNILVIYLSKTLMPNHTYYVTVEQNLVYNTGMGNIAINDNSLLSFQTASVKFQLQTISVLAVNDNTVIASGSINTPDANFINEKGMQIGMYGNPSPLQIMKHPNNLLGNYSVEVSGLQTDKTYWAKAYAIANIDTLYGQLLIFNIKTMDVSDTQIDQFINEVMIYPNPVNNILYVKHTRAENVEVFLCNTLGTVLDSFYVEGESNIDMKYYSTGVYYLKFNIEDKVYYKKITKL